MLGQTSQPLYCHFWYLGAYIVDHSHNISYGNLVECLNPALFATMVNKEDHPTYAEAFYGPDSSSFIYAMER